MFSGLVRLLPTVLLLSKAFAEKDNTNACKNSNIRYKRYLATSLDEPQMKKEPRYEPTAAEHFQVLTIGNALKWDALQPSPGQFNFGPADYVLDFAQKNCMKVRAHTITWHRQAPSYLESLDKNALTEALKTHINTFMKRYGDKIITLDVCNEVFEDDWNSGEFRKDSFWFKTLGTDYIELAFKFARAANPKVKLFINDFSIEGINKKSDAMYKLAKKLKSKNLLDGVGFQAHFIVGQVPDDMLKNFRRFSDLGLETAISELDIRMKMPPSEADMKQQVEDYVKVVKICKTLKSCPGITVWGVAYPDSWIPHEFPEYGNALLFDNDYKPTKAFEAVDRQLRANRQRDNEKDKK
ncbi:glycoside hydrolase superfamily [Melampsora americana]|nr:glycoside hydrolase superfamily [Melampsora americana]